MPDSRRVACLVAYGLIGWTLRSLWPGPALWLIPLLTAAFAGYYVATLRGHAALPPLAALLLTLGVPALAIGRQLWSLFHAWRPVSRQVLQILWAQWPHWLVASLLPVALGLAAAVVAAARTTPAGSSR